MIRNTLLLRIVTVAGVILFYAGCGSIKKGGSSDTNNKRSAVEEVSMKPSASDEDPAYVYFTADSSGYYYTYRIKSNGTGLEKLYESKAGPIWISPDNRYVYITDQVRLSFEEKDRFCPKGITIWNIEKKEKTILPFFDEPTWGSGWYDKNNILYSKYFISSKMIYTGDIGYNSMVGLFKQNIHTGDTSIVICWEKRIQLHALYNEKNNSYYYVNDDSLLVFKAKNRKYVSYPIEYHSAQSNDGSYMLTRNGGALFIHCFDNDAGHFYTLLDLQGKTNLVVDKSIDSGSIISNLKIDLNGKWIYYEGYKDIGGTVYSFIKRKRAEDLNKTETIFMIKMDDMSIGYIALGYDQ